MPLFTRGIVGYVDGIREPLPVFGWIVEGEKALFLPKGFIEWVRCMLWTKGSTTMNELPTNMTEFDWSACVAVAALDDALERHKALGFQPSDHLALFSTFFRDERDLGYAADFVYTSLARVYHPDLQLFQDRSESDAGLCTMMRRAPSRRAVSHFQETAFYLLENDKWNVPIARQEAELAAAELFAEENVAKKKQKPKKQEPLAAPMTADASTASIAFMASIDATASAKAASAELHEEQESAPWTPAAFTSDVAIDLDEAKEPTASPPVITTVAGVVLAAATQADTPTAVATIAELLYWKERAEDLERLLASIHENRAAPKTKHMACQTQRVPRKEVACQSRRIRMMNAECQSDPLPTPSSAPPLAPPLAPPPSAPICTICLTEEANVLCRPCMHIGMCQACGTNIAVRYCPVCRARIKKTESVYIC